MALPALHWNVTVEDVNVDPGGGFSDQVLLTIVSDYGISGIDILPFGGPLLGTNTTTTNTQALIKGVQRTASAPQQILMVGGLDGVKTNIETFADTRIRSTGYSVDDNVPTGGSSSYTFVLTKDTRVTFN